MKLWELRDTINALIELHGVNSRINVIYPCRDRKSTRLNSSHH